jgi:hypothetical protein
MAPSLVVRQSGSFNGTKAMGESCKEACNSERANAGTFAPGLSREGARKGVQPIKGSMILARRASSDALTMTSDAPTPKALRFASVS